MKVCPLLVVAALGFVLPEPARADASRCAVFPSAQERAQCACALRLGGWLTKVQDRWRVVYVRRHQERYCHDKLDSRRAAPN